MLLRQVSSPPSKTERAGGEAGRGRQGTNAPCSARRGGNLSGNLSRQTLQPASTDGGGFPQAKDRSTICEKRAWGAKLENEARILVQAKQARTYGIKNSGNKVILKTHSLSLLPDSEREAELPNHYSGCSSWLQPPHGGAVVSQ